MKAFKTLYQNGQFIDIETGRRVVPRNGQQFTIMSEDDNFVTKDRKMYDGDPLDSSSKKHWIERKYSNQDPRLFLLSGTALRFSIQLTRLDENDIDDFYEFECELLEDLYLYESIRGDSRAVNDPVNYRLAECICELKSCISGNLILLENIREYSLNKLYSSTVQFYFSMRRSSSTNVFNTFFVSDYPDRYRGRDYGGPINLAELRLRVI